MSTNGKLQTLEQLRAQNAWECAQGQGKDYVNLAKGLPALIMNSGLMQVMAFLEEKGSKDKQGYYHTLSGQLRDWLAYRKLTQSKDFSSFMSELMKADPHRFQQITAETFAWLRWVRQVSSAVVKAKGD